MPIINYNLGGGNYDEEIQELQNDVISLEEQILILQSRMQLPWIAGRYYDSHSSFFWTTNILVSVTPTASGTTKCSLTALWVGAKTREIDRIAVNCTSGQSNSRARMGIYTSNSLGLPGSLLAQSDPINTVSSGVKEFSFASNVEVSGLIWLGFAANSVAGFDSFRTNSSDNRVPYLGYSSITESVSDYAHCLTFDFSLGSTGSENSFPETPGALSASDSACARVLLRAA